MKEQPKYIFFTDRDLGKQFPNILKENGISVERHCDHFEDDAKDEDWLSEIGSRGWYVITRDKNIRYKPNEKAAVERFNVGLFILIGDIKHIDLAYNFVNTYPRIIKFIEKNSCPFIAKIYRPEKKRKSGRVTIWKTFH
jgi:hypothetical protein